MLTRCELCGNEYNLSKYLRICGNCIEKNPKAIQRIRAVQKKVGSEIGLPSQPPKDKKGIRCGVCANNCVIGPNKIGFCGLTKNQTGKLVRFAGDKIGLGVFSIDAHKTNCVSSWVCAGGTGAGYPKYSYSKAGPEYGYFSFAFALGTCNYRCLYCQNQFWHDTIKERSPLWPVNIVAKHVEENERISCVCYYGGDVCPQLPYVIESARLARKIAEEEDRILRICLETNGGMNSKLMKKIAKISFKSGGGIKFDLKMPRGSLKNIALSGVPNEASYKNFERLVEFHQKRPEVPFLRASTLLVPHYITVNDIKQIADFITSLDKTIPYSLLAFYPHYLFTDLGLTSRSFAEKCYRVAKEAGLEKVNIGNVHLLR